MTSRANVELLETEIDDTIIMSHTNNSPASRDVNEPAVTSYTQAALTSGQAVPWCTAEGGLAAANHTYIHPTVSPVNDNDPQPETLTQPTTVVPLISSLIDNNNNNQSPRQVGRPSKQPSARNGKSRRKATPSNIVKIESSLAIQLKDSVVAKIERTPVPVPKTELAVEEHPEIAANGEEMKTLMELQTRLATMNDVSLLRKVVQLIQKSGKYCLEDATFDFDLCILDRETIEQLRECLAEPPSSI